MHLFDRYSDHDYQFELLGEEEHIRLYSLDPSAERLFSSAQY
jgi:hypothetical protein